MELFQEQRLGAMRKMLQLPWKRQLKYEREVVEGSIVEWVLVEGNYTEEGLTVGSESRRSREVSTGAGCCVVGRRGEPRVLLLMFSLFYIALYCDSVPCICRGLC
jgi:hypothetical protein